MSEVENIVLDEAPQPNDEASLLDQVEALKKQLASAEKRISETYSAYQAGQKQVRSMEKDMRERSRPALLDETEGLHEAIRYVTELERSRPTEEEIWTSTVAKALPDLDGLMNDSSFKDIAMRQRQESGDQWNDPIVAIGRLSSVRADYLRDRAVETERGKNRASKADAMEVPGGGSGVNARDKVAADPAAEIMAMSTEDFRRMRDKVLGY